MDLSSAKKSYSSALHSLMSNAQRHNGSIGWSEDQTPTQCPNTPNEGWSQFNTGPGKIRPRSFSTPTLTQLERPKPDQIMLGGVTVKHSNTALLPTITEYPQIQTSMPTSNNCRTILPKPSENTNHRERIDMLGPGWPRSYIPPCHRPWHHQHPSVIANGLLIETCSEYKSVFPNSKDTFEPANMPWWTLWLVAFAARQTTLKEADICLLYKFKYKDFVPGIEHMEEKHTVELWNFLNDGEHGYAFEWDHSDEYEDALKMLLDVWLSDAHLCEGRRMAVEDRQRGLEFDFEASEK